MRASFLHHGATELMLKQSETLSDRNHFVRNLADSKTRPLWKLTTAANKDFSHGL